MKANLGVDLLVIVYEIRNDTVFNHSSIISSNMALECPDIVFYPANMRRWLNVGLLLAHRLRSWPNSKPALSHNIACSAHFPQSLKSYEHLHFPDPVVEISDRHVDNVILQGKTNTVIHGPHINGIGSSIAIIILTIMWK